MKAREAAIAAATASNTGSRLRFGASVMSTGAIMAVIAEAAIDNLVSGTIVGDASFDITSEPGDPCTGDLDGDCAVGASDLANPLASWGPCAGCPADVDGNGVVDAADLAFLLSNWG